MARRSTLVCYSWERGGGISAEANHTCLRFNTFQARSSSPLQNPALCPKFLSSGNGPPPTPLLTLQRYHPFLPLPYLSNQNMDSESEPEYSPTTITTTPTVTLPHYPAVFSHSTIMLPNVLAYSLLMCLSSASMPGMQAPESKTFSSWFTPVSPVPRTVS